AETAIAHDRGRDPERRRWRKGRVPGDLRVVMSVQVDDARHQREPAGIDDLGRVVANLADRSDAATLDCNVGADRIMPESIHHRGAADDEVMHRHLLLDVFYRRRLFCIAPTGRGDYHAGLHASIRLIRREMDQPQSADTRLGSFQTKGSDTESTGTTQQGVDTGDFGWRNPGKPVGAVVAAARVLRILHGSERSLNASEVARAAGLHRGTAYNILRTLQAEGFVGYD